MTKFFMSLPPSQSSFRDIFLQALLAALLVALGVTVFQQIQIRYSEIGIDFSFGFLGQTAGYEIADPIIEYEVGDSHAGALLVGALSSLWLAVLVILISTVFAVIATLARLSRYRVLSFSADSICNILRNTPLLAQLALFLFIGFVFVRMLPRPAQAGREFGFFLTSRGLYMPWIDNLLPLITIFLITFAAALLFRHKLQQRLTNRFINLPTWLTWFLPLLVVVLAGWAFNIAPAIELPMLNERGFKIIGGAKLAEEMIVAIFAFSFYASSQLSDVFYYHIRALHAEKSDQHAPIGLRNTLKFASGFFPRFLQSISLPTADCYLTIFKNTALSGAVLAFGFQDAISTTLNQSGQFLEVTAIAFLFYLTVGVIALILMRVYRTRLTYSSAILLQPVLTGVSPNRNTPGVLSWLRENLFYDGLSTVVTCLSALLFVYASDLIWNWGILWSDAIAARFLCTSAVNSCWGHVAELLDLTGRLKQLLVGFVPEQEIWRGYLAIALFLVSLLICSFAPLPRRTLLLFIFLTTIAMWSVTPGILPGAPTNDLARMGGLWLTLLLASLATLAGFTIGNALALGSLSRLPLVSVTCKSVISGTNTIPPVILITSAAFVLTTYLMPDGISRQFRFYASTAGLILVASAQFAAVIRESLQLQTDSLPTRGKLSLAVRNAIPELTRTAVCQLHYTTFYRGVFATHDLLHVAKSVGWDRDWQPVYLQLILLVALVYLLISNLILFAGRRIEARRMAQLTS